MVRLSYAGSEIITRSNDLVASENGKNDSNIKYIYTMKKIKNIYIIVL